MQSHFMQIRMYWLLLAATLALCVPAYAGHAQRIVSLDLCTDWMLARYVDRSRIAALSPMHRKFTAPGMVTDWPIHDGTLETVLDLQPDLVITGQYNMLQLRSRLKALGIRVEILPLPTTLAAVTDYEVQFLTTLGLPAHLASQPPPARPAATRRRLLLLGANGIGTGRGTFEDAILERAGWRNYLPDAGYLRLDLERIAVDPPEAMLWAAPANPALANQFARHPVLRRAIPRERWLTTDYWRWQCPGPWTWELIEQLNRWRH